MDSLKALGTKLNTATTLSDETRQRLATGQASAQAKLSAFSATSKAWLSITKNQRILLYSLVTLMVIVNFAVFWSLDMDKIKKDDVDELAKLGHLSRISIFTLLFVIGLGFFEVMAYRKE
jgi:hypothetical protein